MKARAKELGLPNSRVNTAGCLDRCELGPVIVIYPEGVWYGVKNKDEVDEILHALKTQSEPVERLRLPPGVPPAPVQGGDPAGGSSPDHR
jgi:(2Fe-2S) ferredoxin